MGSKMGSKKNVILPSRKSRQYKPCEEICCKCGYDIISRNFFSKDMEVCRTYYRSKDYVFSYGYLNVKHNIVKAKQDLIEHHCKCCHYEWYTDTLPDDWTQPEEDLF